MIYDLSIIIPFYNAKKFINRSFKNCKELSKIINAQILYIDNISNDNSFNILKKKIKSKKNFNLLKTTKKFSHSPGIARNLGIKNSKSDNIIFLDIDDELNIKGIKKLIQFLKKNNSNIIYLKKKIIDKKKYLTRKESPYIKYNKKNMQEFFNKSINMAAISIIFKRKFLLENKLFFNRGIYEDIFFLFKAHFYNNRIIKIFPITTYKRYIHKRSITNTKISVYHLSCMFEAWKNINNFLKKKLSTKKYKILDKSIQFRLRGEFANEYYKIVNSKIGLRTKKNYLNFIVKKYRRFIKSNFKVLTIKDKIVQRVLEYK